MYKIHHNRGTQNVTAETLSHMYDADIHIPVSPVLLELPMLYEDTGTHLRANPVLSALAY
jgi:hypothetical protein